MIVENFLIEPAMFVPGEEVTISFTVTAEKGDEIGSGGLYVHLGLPSGTETIAYRDAAFTITAGSTKSVSARTVPVSTAYASSLSRGTVLDAFGVQLGQFGSRVNVVFPVTLLDAWYSPSIALFQLERATNGVPDDEGEKIISDALLGVSENADTGNMSLRLYYSSDGMPTQDSASVDLSIGITVLLMGVTDNPTLVSGTFSKAEDWHFLLVFGDEYESARVSCMVARSFANMHLSGNADGGVCFGGFSTSGQDDPRLESYYPAYLYGGVKQLGDGWTYLAPLTGSTPAAYGGGALRCRAIENKRIIDGSLLFKPGSSAVVLAQLPDGYVPASTVFSLNACDGSRIACISVPGGSDANAGMLVCSWVRNLSNGGLYTSAEIWVQCSIEYWVD